MLQIIDELIFCSFKLGVVLGDSIKSVLNLDPPPVLCSNLSIDKVAVYFVLLKHKVLISSSFASKGIIILLSYWPIFKL